MIRISGQVIYTADLPIGPMPKPVMEFRSVFVGGSGRCGTHWLLKLLLAHPDAVGFRGESKIYPVFAPLLNDPEWKQKALDRYFSYPEGTRMRHAVSEPFFLDIVERASRLPPSDQVPAAIRLLLEGFFVEAGGTPPKVLVEKTPQNILYAKEILESNEGAVFVEMVRNPKDVYVSFQKQRLERGLQPKTLEQVVERWRRAVHAGKAASGRYRDSGRYLQIQYEDLFYRFETTLARVFPFCGLDTDAGFLRYLKASDYAVNVSNRAQAGSWRQDLGSKEAARIEELLHDEMNDLQYD